MVRRPLRGSARWFDLPRGVVTSSARPRDAGATRRDILDATLELFAHRGYRGTSIAAIAERVGITDAAVLYHYPNKRAIFSAVVGHFADIQAARFLELIRPNGLAAIRNLAEWGAVMESRPDLLRLQILLSAEALTDESEMGDYFVNRYAQLHALLRAIFEHGVRTGEIRPATDIDHEVTALLAHLDGARLVWFYDQQPPRSLANHVAAYVEQLVSRVADPRRSPP